MCVCVCVCACVRACSYAVIILCRNVILNIIVNAFEITTSSCIGWQIGMISNHLSVFAEHRDIGNKQYINV